MLEAEGVSLDFALGLGVSPDIRGWYPTKTALFP